MGWDWSGRNFTWAQTRMTKRDPQPNLAPNRVQVTGPAPVLKFNLKTRTQIQTQTGPGLRPNILMQYT